MVLTDPRPRSRRAFRARRAVAAWSRFALLAGITALVLSPVLELVARALSGSGRAGPSGFSLDGLLAVAENPTARMWFGNSLEVSLVTVAATILLAAPAGYALSRARGRLAGAAAFTLFLLQSLPILLFLVALFLVFVHIGLIDSLPGLSLIYMGLTTPFAIWMLVSAFDGIPAALEEAAWLDGCSIFGGFVRIVLRNALPGVLSVVVYTFLFAWSDYWVADVFLQTDTNFTVGLALAAAGGFPALAVAAMIPPIVVFAVFSRFFRFGGLGGSFAGG